MGLGSVACGTNVSPRTGDAGPVDAKAEVAVDAAPNDDGSKSEAADGGADGQGEGDDGASPSADASTFDDAATSDAVSATDGASSSDGACTAVLDEHTAAVGNHLDFCSTLAFTTNPPSSGNHYPSWPAFKIYERPVPWGYLVHGLEHGAVVISYNCPDGCAADLAAAKALVASLPNKAGCETPSVILTPDPSLDVRFAASAWNDPKAYTLRASCFLPDAFRSFYATYADRNYESSCGGGDWSSNGWCPPGTPPPCGPGCS